jgi:hypothetical protein
LCQKSLSVLLRWLNRNTLLNVIMIDE